MSNETTTSYKDLFSSLRSPACSLHPSCFFDVAVAGEVVSGEYKSQVVYVKTKQLNALTKAADTPYSFYSPLEGLMRDIETSLHLGCNENIIQSLLADFASLELHMSLMDKAYQSAKQNQLLWKFYTDNVAPVFKLRKELGKMAVALSETFIEEGSELTNTIVWGMWKTSQRASQEAYKALEKERNKHT